jgi:hypothetical protein
MTRLKINPGACGLVSDVEVRRKGGKVFALMVRSDCEMVRKLCDELKELETMDVFKGILENPVYRKGSSCLRHVSCPVPSGILKALEVEAGLAVPRDVSMTFESGGKAGKAKKNLKI